jgi:hypothetical protein
LYVKMGAAMGGVKIRQRGLGSCSQIFFVRAGKLWAAFLSA